MDGGFFTLSLAHYVGKSKIYAALFKFGKYVRRAAERAVAHKFFKLFVRFAVGVYVVAEYVHLDGRIGGNFQPAHAFYSAQSALPFKLRAAVHVVVVGEGGKPDAVSFAHFSDIRRRNHAVGII